MLPTKYAQILAAGVKALEWIETDLRTRALRQPDSPELWLSVRDVHSLWSRIDWDDDWTWRTGAANVLLSGQDIGVLDELIADLGDSAYRDDELASERARIAADIRAFRDFLRRYMAAEFEFEDLAWYGPPGGGARES